MRRLTLAAGIACAILLMNHVWAQNATAPGGTSSSTTTTSAPGGTMMPTMPGQVIGGYRGQVFPVGNKLPVAAPQAGMPITANAMQRPYDPSHPFDAFKGTNIDPKQVLAPLVGPDGKQVQPPDALDKLSENIKAFFTRSPPPPRPTYAPGIARRNKERFHRLWRRD
jgi:hypothetical protein